LNHPDNRAIGDAALCAAFPAAGNLGVFPHLWPVEGLPLAAPSDVLLAALERPDYQVGITESMDQKTDAVRQHKSQLTDPVAQLECVRQRNVQEDGRYVKRFG